MKIIHIKSIGCILEFSNVQESIVLDLSTDEERVAVALKLLEDCDHKPEFEDDEDLIGAAIANLEEYVFIIPGVEYEDGMGV